tara:strand:+ start:2043 stop:2474 length:432 start_codon:yes stop_codon:yes gene_type:complete
MSRPKVRVRKRLFREVSYLKKDRLKQNHLKNIYYVRRETCKTYNISKAQLFFLLWCYDKEFWTIQHAVENYPSRRDYIEKKFMWPLIKEGYIYKHFDKLTPRNGEDAHMFREETKYNYSVRYAISTKARQLIQRFYRDLEIER